MIAAHPKVIGGLRMKTALIIVMAAVILAGVAMKSHGYFEEMRKDGPAGSNLVANSGLEYPQPEDIKNPYGWQNGHWGNNRAKFTYLKTGGINNSRAIQVSISRYRDGDAKWYFDYIGVHGGQRYRFSDWYRSDNNSTLTLCTDSENTILNASIAPAANWTKVEETFTMPKDATRATVFHLLSGNGNLTTDSYSFAPVGFEEDKRNFKSTMISLVFIDGDPQKYWNAAKTIGREPYYWKATFYVEPVWASDNEKFYDGGRMIDRVGWSGNEIGINIGSENMDDAQKIGTWIIAAKNRWQAYRSIALPHSLTGGNKQSISNISDFDSNLGKDRGYNVPSGFDKYNLVSVDGNNLSLDDFKKTISQASDEKAWIIIRYRDAPPKDQLDWLLANGLNPAPISETLEEILPQLPD